MAHSDTNSGLNSQKSNIFRDISIHKISCHSMVENLQATKSQVSLLIDVFQR